MQRQISSTKWQQMSKPTPPELRFAADVMLGRLAKWLRVLGQDVIYGRHLSGAGLIRVARQEKRIILTRDRRLRRQPQQSLLIESDNFREQLRQVVTAFHLIRDNNLFKRCLLCSRDRKLPSKERCRNTSLQATRNFFGAPIAAVSIGPQPITKKCFGN
jgi:uncharacterized protein with PIN domain